MAPGANARMVPGANVDNLLNIGLMLAWYQALHAAPSNAQPFVPSSCLAERKGEHHALKLAALRLFCY